MKNLVSVKWLSEHFEDPELIVLDASPKSNTAGLHAPFPDLQILNARRFDFTGRFADQETSLPNMMPSPSRFEIECQKLGLQKTSRIVVYDNLGIYSSPRVWWMFKVMGHDNVAVLDGGLPAWKRAGLDCQDLSKDDIEFEEPESNFVANFRSRLVKNMSQISTQQNGRVIDARSKARFDGVVPEARRHLKSGHIPGSINLPFLELLKDGHFVSLDKIAEKFAAFAEEKELIFSCGSGVTACVLILAASLVSDATVSLYDGSWSEWGQLADGFIEK